MLRYMTAGESHGRAVMVIVDGVPAGLTLDIDLIASDLKRRMHGYGRGGRMEIETEEPILISGVRMGKTIGSPVGIMIENKDHKIDILPDVKNPRPGHSDLAAIQKYGFGDARDALERASARETAMRVAAGGVARNILGEFGIRIVSHIKMIGGIEADVSGLTIDQIVELSDVSASPIRCADRKAEKKMLDLIDTARGLKDTLGGVFEVIAEGVPPGLGTYAQWDRRIDGAICRALASIPAVKAVSIGDGIAAAGRKGSEVHDPIGWDPSRAEYTRSSNNAGGIEAGITNGEPVVAAGYMKPIATLGDGLPTVNIDTGEPGKADSERSDVSAVSACGVVGEAVVAIELASAFLDKFGGDCMMDIKKNYTNYMERLKGK